MASPTVSIMPNKRKTEISPWQLFMVLICVPFSTFTAFTPLLSSAPGVSRDAWIAAVIAALVATGGLWLIYLYALKFPGMSLGRAVRLAFGPIVGAVVNVALIALFVVWAAITLKQFAFFLSGPIYPETPTIVFSTLFIGVCIMAAAALVEGGVVFFFHDTVPAKILWKETQMVGILLGDDARGPLGFR